MKDKDVILIGVGGLALLFFARQGGERSFLPDGGLSSGFNLSMPDIKMPDIKMPDIGFSPTITMMAGAKDALDTVKENVEKVVETVKDTTTPDGEGFLEQIKEWLNQGRGEPDTTGDAGAGQGDQKDTPKDNTQRVPGFSGDPWGDWVNQVTGWQNAPNLQSFDITALLGTRTGDKIEEKYRVDAGAFPWQTPTGEGFIAPWTKVAFNKDTGKVVLVRNLFSGEQAGEQDQGRESGSGKVPFIEEYEGESR